MKQLPNIITMLNLLIGCFAVAAAFSGHPAQAALFIIVCALLDFLDGAAARILHAGSELGKQLDSLADLISFGMAPAAIMYYYLQSNPISCISINTSVTTWLPHLAFLITIFSAIRLARFNIDDRQKNIFIGLPTPANALFFSSIPLVINYSIKKGVVYATLINLTSNHLAMLVLIILFSVLLVAPMKMFSIKFRSVKFNDNKLPYVFILFSVFLFFIVGWGGLVFIIPLYILLSLLANIQGLLSANHNK